MYDSYLQLRRMYDINYDSHISISDGVIISFYFTSFITYSFSNKFIFVSWQC